MPANRCAREGCPRPPRAGHVYCTMLCANVDQEFDYLQKLLTGNGDHPLATEAWLALVEVGDALSRYRSMVRTIHHDNQNRRRPRRGAGPAGSSSVAGLTDSSPS